MKKTMFLVAAGLSLGALAATLEVTWQASPSPSVTQYRVYTSTNEFHLIPPGGTVWLLQQSVVAAPGTNVTWLSNLSAPPVRSIAVSAADTNGSESLKLAGPVLFAPRQLTIREVP